MFTKRRFLLSGRESDVQLSPLAYAQRLLCLGALSGCAPASRAADVNLVTDTPPANAAGVHAVPQPQSVRCTFSYGGESHTLSAVATTDPYSAPLQAVFPRFAARIVYLAPQTGLGSFSLYVYDADPSDGASPLLLQESKYYPPFGDHPKAGFTGLQFAYKNGLGEELAYFCRVGQA